MEVDFIYYVITGISSHRLISMQELSNELSSEVNNRRIIWKPLSRRTGKEVKISLNSLVSIPHLGIAITRR